MINLGFSIGSLLGLLDIGLAIAYLIESILLLTRSSRDRNDAAIALYVLQLLIVPLPIFLFGSIMIFQGWRLDPLLQFAYFLLQLPLVFFGVKDWILFNRSE